jgi:hypothetical protein
VCVLTLRDTILRSPSVRGRTFIRRRTYSEHDDFLGQSLGIPLEREQLRVEHVGEVRDDLTTPISSANDQTTSSHNSHSTLLKTDAWDESNVVSVGGSDGDGDRWWQGTSSGRRVSDLKVISIKATLSSMNHSHRHR